MSEARERRLLRDNLNPQGAEEYWDIEVNYGSNGHVIVSIKR